MVQLDIPAAFAVSMLALDLGRNVLKTEAEKTDEKKPLVYYRYLFRSVFFAGFVIAPAGTYLLAGWPGWEQIYWSERFEQVMHTGWVNALLPAFFVMAIVLAAYWGHVLGYRWLVSGKAKYIRPTYIGVLIAAGIVVLCFHPAFLMVGKYADYHDGKLDATNYVWRNPYGFSVGWVGVMVFFVVALGCLIRIIRKENRGCTGS